MSMMKSVPLEDMLHYAIDFYSFLYSDDNIAPHICVYSPASTYIFGEHSDYNRSFAMTMVSKLLFLINKSFTIIFYSQKILTLVHTN